MTEKSLQPHAKAAFGPAVFVLSLIGLGLLPMLPEIVLFFQNHSDLKVYKTIWYYEFIVSFLLLIPALLLPRLLARGWAILITALVCPATVIVGFYSAAHGVRWNLTAHTAFLETNRTEALGYLRVFLSFGRLVRVLFLVSAFAGCLIAYLRSRPPSRRSAWLGAFAGLLLSAYGLDHAYLYANKPFRVTDSVSMVGLGYISLHPLLLFSGTHYNYRSSRQYYLSHFRDVEAHLGELNGARPLPGAMSPRVGVVVIGESANRRHWSLYGYPRDTTPGMRALGDQLFVFSDVISSAVGTLPSIRGMMTTPDGALPVFRLFTGAGYTTHWISTRNDNGDELQLAALVESCDDRVYLSGAYDESLLPFLSKALAMPGKQMIFLNLTGSHVRYSDDYPIRQTVFSAAGAIPQFVATYDNSIRYTDYVLSQIVAEMQKRDEASFMLYVSDHGEDVYDSRPDQYLFRSDLLATDPMYEVPFIVWLSPRYVAENREFVAGPVAAAVHNPFQNKELYHTLIDLARLTHPLYDASKDVLSPQFVKRERRVGAMERVYRGSNGP